MTDTKKLAVNFFVALAVGVLTLAAGNFLIGKDVNNTTKILSVVLCFSISAWSAVRINRLDKESKLESLKNALKEVEKLSG
jgi:hypothetical protein